MINGRFYTFVVALAFMFVCVEKGEGGDEEREEEDALQY